MKLVIVESPNKCKKIREYLGAGYEVHASVGHIRDLPLRDIGVASPDFKPHYEVSERSKPVVAKLKKLVKSADLVYLATDPDREGEAIAWHLKDELKPSNYKRITFNAITKKAIQEAITKAGPIDVKMVAAQECRRVIDRIVGYMVSPVLTKLAGGGTSLSAGRVQSVALRIVVDREREIQNFVASDYFEVKADFPWAGKNEVWTAKWHHQSFQEAMGLEKTDHFTDGGFVGQFVQALTANPHFQVSRVESKPTSQKPPAPFTTSTLQQAASVKLHIGVDAAMKAAQSLFEAGLITYHRTDSPNFEEESAVDIRNWLSSNGHKVVDKSYRWPTKGDAQEAHEAIRPTDISVQAAPGFSAESDEGRLYQMIWLRTAASQMPAAQFHSTRVLLMSAVSIRGQNQPFIATGRVLLDPGWMAMSGEDAAEEKPDSDAPPEKGLPALTQGQSITSTAVRGDTCKTKAPARLTIAALVKALEQNGIGRPSTYASIMTNIQKRNYIEERARKVYATDLGMAVCDTLVGRFSFMDLPFTRMMESALDKVAKGEAQYRAVVAHQHGLLEGELGRIDFGAASADRSRFSGVTPESVTCPACNVGTLRRRKGNSGHFWGCSNYPECKASAPEKSGKKGVPPEPDLDALRVPDPNEVKPEVVLSDENCPKCKKNKLALRNGSRGPFWSCRGFPKCKAAFNDANGKPDLE